MCDVEELSAEDRRDGAKEASEAEDAEEEEDGAFASLHRQLSDPLVTRLAGSYSLPVGAPDLTGDRPTVAQSLASEPIPEEVWRSSISKSGQKLLIVLFLAFDSSRYVLSTWGLLGKNDGSVLGQLFVAGQSLGSLASAVAVCGSCYGFSGLRKACELVEVARWLPVAVGFSLAQGAIYQAFGHGVGAATAVAIGYLYMPLCAIVSRWLFRRKYGWLETHALALLTLSALAFAELRSRAMTLSEGLGGSQFALASAVFACGSSLMSEWVLKPRYSARTVVSFPLQKLRLEFWDTLASIFLLYLISSPEKRLKAVRDWDWKLWLALAVGVLQSWLAGLVAKHFSTVAKAVLQCLSSLIVFFGADLVILGRATGSLPMGLLGLVVALSALMYQMGRSRTIAKRTAVLPAAASQSFLESEDVVGPRASASEEAIFVPDAMAPREFRPRQEERLARLLPQCPRLDGVLDRGWLARASRYNARLAEWASSRRGIMSQLACVAGFIAADVGRTLVYAWALNGTAIVQQSLVVAMSAASIVVGALFSAVLEGGRGVKDALDFREAVRYFPVAACFSLGTTCTVFAYGVGVSAVQVTVIGYAYIPLSALLSRWIFKRAYGGLEWLALVLMVLSVSAFVLMQNEAGGSKLTVFGVAFVLVSVALSCVASMLAEKIMKSGQRPFYMQNTSLQIGSLITAVVLLFVNGFISTRPNDAFWKPRDVGDGKMASGILVGWGPKILIALLASTLQSWLAGLVAKRLSTVTRAVAQCLELVIIYFFGDLVLKHKHFDWPVGLLALAVALTVQVFAQAGQKPEADTA